MAQPNEYKEVDFETYCKKCKYRAALEWEEPCCDCISEAVNFHSVIPVKFKEKE